jgi:hypothetical protein
MAREGDLGSMTTYGRSASDVRAWPEDPVARRALEDYFAALPRDPKIVIPSLNGRGLDFTGADMSGLELAGALFNDADLSGVRLVGAHLTSVWLIGAVLRNADLSHASLRKAQGRACDAQDAVAVGADLRSAEFEDANLNRIDLRDVHLGNAWLLNADLRSADLRACVFGQDGTWTSLTESRISGCILDGASGSVTGPADVGVDSPRLIDGAELGRWFAEHGAPGVEIHEAIRQ